MSHIATDYDFNLVGERESEYHSLGGQQQQHLFYEREKRKRERLLPESVILRTEYLEVWRPLGFEMIGRVEGGGRANVHASHSTTVTYTTPRVADK